MQLRKLFTSDTYYGALEYLYQMTAHTQHICLVIILVSSRNQPTLKPIWKRNILRFLFILFGKLLQRGLLLHNGCMVNSIGVILLQNKLHQPTTYNIVTICFGNPNIERDDTIYFPCFQYHFPITFHNSQNCEL